MLLLIWIILILLGLVIRRSKTVSALQVFFVSIMIALNTNNPDREQYYNLFLRLKSGAQSVLNGNIITNILFKSLSFLGGYEIVLFFVALLCMILIWRSIIFFTSQISFVLSMYLIASFTIDATQIKNFIAMSIWLSFTRFLYLAFVSEDNRLRNVIIYMIGCLLATGAHFSFAYTFLFAAVIILRDKKSINVRTVCLSILLFIIVFNADSIFSLFSNVNSAFFVLTTRKISEYRLTFNEQNMLVRMRRVIEVFVVMVLFLDYCIRWDNKESHLEISKYALFLKKIVYLSFFILPFMKYSLEIYRIQRNLLILFYILFAKQNIDEERPKEHLFTIKLEPFPVMGLFLSNIYLILDSIFGNFESVFRTLFRV